MIAAVYILLGSFINHRMLLAVAYPTKKKRGVSLHPFRSYGGVPKVNKKDGYRQQNVRQRQKLISII